MGFTYDEQCVYKRDNTVDLFFHKHDQILPISIEITTISQGDKRAKGICKWPKCTAFEYFLVVQLTLSIGGQLTMETLWFFHNEFNKRYMYISVKTVTLLQRKLRWRYALILSGYFHLERPWLFLKKSKSFKKNLSNNQNT